MTMPHQERYPKAVVTALIFNSKNELLLLKSKDWSDMYIIPGGKIEYGESIEEALKREAKEETNLDID